MLPPCDVVADRESPVSANRPRVASDTLAHVRSVFVDCHGLPDAGVHLRTGTGDLGTPCICHPGLGFLIEAPDQFERKWGHDPRREDGGFRRAVNFDKLPAPHRASWWWYMGDDTHGRLPARLSQK